MNSDIFPITDTEREQRREKARRLMAEHHLDAVFLEAGSSLSYFTSLEWGRSERMFAMIFPAKGEPVYVVPGFEEQRASEIVPVGSEVRVWEEDENPAERVAQVLRDKSIDGGRIGVEETVRFFLFDALREADPQSEFVRATAVTAGCRMIKSAAELAIMTRANEIALRSAAEACSALHDGMTHLELKARCEEAMRRFGCAGESTVTFGEATALPHGSSQVQRLKEGDSIVIDAVSILHGYHGDITRSFVFGKPSEHQREMWNLEREAQTAGFAAVKVGNPCESVDAAARSVLTKAGLGPDYRLPGLPHRTGHGIGLDVHEWPYLVKGNKLPLQPGMCFSDEPMIVIPGKFGIRLEDCFYVSEDGPETFTEPSVAMEDPFGKYAPHV